MNYKIEIRVENATFDYYPEMEVGDILHELTHKLQNGVVPLSREVTLMDVNGNTVGHAWLEKDEFDR